MASSTWEPKSTRKIIKFNKPPDPPERFPEWRQKKVDAYESYISSFKPRFKNYSSWKKFINKLTLEDFLGYNGRPKDFLLDMWPWRLKGGPLHNQQPHEWQLQYMEDWGSNIEKRKKERSFRPVKMATLSGHGTGKSCLSSFIILYLHMCYRNSAGTVTANTSRQLRGKTMRELGKWFKMNPVFENFTTFYNAPNNMSLRHHEDTSLWFMEALTVADNSPESFQGQHSANSASYYLFDEASAISDEIFLVAKYGLVTSEGHMHLFGNGTRSVGTFRRAFSTEAHEWNTRTIDKTDVDPYNDSIFEELEKLGFDSDEARIRILGGFPSAGSNQLIGFDFIDAAMEPKNRPDTTYPLVFGVDPSGWGDDELVIFPVRGGDCCLLGHEITQSKLKDTSLQVDLLCRRIDEEKPELVCVDAGGLGQGFIDELHRRKYFNIHPINFANKSPSTGFANMRAYCYGKLKSKLESGLLNLPKIMRLREQIGAITYTLRPSDHAVQIDSKADIKAALGHSPDLADALCLALAIDVAPVIPSKRRKDTIEFY